MDKNGKIGVFDSGIGGVTVLKELVKLLPNEEFLYYSDSKNNPYGEKDDEDLLKICDEIVRFLINNKCKIIVIACNTASAKAAKFLRDKYKEIPIIAIEPAYKMVHDYAYDKSTLIMATKGTIESEKFNLLYKKYDNHKTFLMPCVGLAELIEENQSKKIWEYLEKNIAVYRNKVENVVLGCTHYPLIKKEIKSVLGKVKFFDGSKMVAKHVKEILKENNLENKSNLNIDFIDSNNSEIKKERFFNFIKK